MWKIKNNYCVTDSWWKLFGENRSESMNKSTPLDCKSSLARLDWIFVSGRVYLQDLSVL